MAYHYEDHRPFVLTDKGQRAFLAARDKAKALLAQSGAVMAIKLMDAAAIAGATDSWEAMACVDRLVELNELREIPRNPGCAWQHKVFVGTNL